MISCFGEGKMGGQEGSRGYLYQGVASIFQALQDDKWEKIFVEYSSPNDKVDIAFENYSGVVVKAIQVKSSVNLFSKSEITSWINDLISDVESQEYILMLIGACVPAANKFIKCIEKYNALDDKNLKDMETTSTLGEFVKVLECHQISVCFLPFNQDSLLSTIRDMLHRYISSKGHVLTFSAIEELAYALISMQMLLGTKGKYIDRGAYDSKIMGWLECSTNGEITRVKRYSGIKFFSYDMKSKLLNEQISLLKVSDLLGYKDKVNELLNIGRDLIGKISNISLCKYEDEEKKHYNAQGLPRVLINQAGSAQKNNKEKQRVIEDIKKFWDINISDDFFYVGNLKKNDIFMSVTGSISYEGEEIEKQKNNLINNLDYIIWQLKAVDFFISTLKNVKIIPLCIKNVGSITDEDITVCLHLVGRENHFYDIEIDCEQKEKAILNIFASILIEEDLLDTIFKVESNNIINVLSEDEMPFISTMNLETILIRKKYGLQDLIYRMENYFIKATGETIVFEVSKLRSGENILLYPFIAVVTNCKEIELEYSILSNNLGEKVVEKIKVIEGK